MITVIKKKYDRLILKRTGDGEIPVMSAYGELWSNFLKKVLKILDFKN